jgi:hypothetical protein
MHTELMAATLLFGMLFAGKPRLNFFKYKKLIILLDLKLQETDFSCSFFCEQGG